MTGRLDYPISETLVPDRRNALMSVSNNPLAGEGRVQRTVGDYLVGPMGGRIAVEETSDCPTRPTSSPPSGVTSPVFDSVVLHDSKP